MQQEGRREVGERRRGWDRLFEVCSNERGVVMAHLLLFNSVCVHVWPFSLLCTHICASTVLHDTEVRVHDCFINGCLWVDLPVRPRWSEDDLVCLWVRNRRYKAFSCCPQRVGVRDWEHFHNLTSAPLRCHFNDTSLFYPSFLSPPSNSDSLSTHPCSPSPTSSTATRHRWQIKLFFVKIQHAKYTVFPVNEAHSTWETFRLRALAACYVVGSSELAKSHLLAKFSLQVSSSSSRGLWYQLGYPSSV